jgi:hypothetical protein
MSIFYSIPVYFFSSFFVLFSTINPALAPSPEEILDEASQTATLVAYRELPEWQNENGCSTMEVSNTDRSFVEALKGLSPAYAQLLAETSTESGSIFDGVTAYELSESGDSALQGSQGDLGKKWPKLFPGCDPESDDVGRIFRGKSFDVDVETLRKNIPQIQTYLNYNFPGFFRGSLPVLMKSGRLLNEYEIEKLLQSESLDLETLRDGFSHFLYTTIGSAKIPLIPHKSVAVDPRNYDHGVPIFFPALANTTVEMSFLVFEVNQNSEGRLQLTPYYAHGIPVEHSGKVCPGDVGAAIRNTNFDYFVGSAHLHRGNAFAKFLENLYRQPGLFESKTKPTAMSMRGIVLDGPEFEELRKLCEPVFPEEQADLIDGAYGSNRNVAFYTEIQKLIHRLFH